MNDVVDIMSRVLGSNIVSGRVRGEVGVEIVKDNELYTAFVPKWAISQSVDRHGMPIADTYDISLLPLTRCDVVKGNIKVSGQKAGFFMMFHDLVEMHNQEVVDMLEGRRSNPFPCLTENMSVTTDGVQFE